MRLRALVTKGATGYRARGRDGVRCWLVAPLIVFCGGSTAGCRPPDCENDTAPEGTRFQVEVLEEMPHSYGCHLFAIQPAKRSS